MARTDAAPIAARIEVNARKGRVTACEEKSEAIAGGAVTVVKVTSVRGVTGGTGGGKS